jgi:UDP-N-acetylglucosamine--N-acetylmuramyl-(pentapeptide) pyrophosphoryl-undecaprenol N-acetylglucosamine transferase
MPQGGYLFAGGGTGGHLTPAIAVAEGLRERFGEIPLLFVGSGRPLEHTFLACRGFVHHALPTASLPQLRRRPLSSARELCRGVRAAKQLLHEQQPRVVIGCGGFASAPCVWSAQRLGIRVVLLEQNVLPGRATRWLSRLADAVCLSFEESRDWLPRRAQCLVTGNPVRRAFAALVDRPPQVPARRLLLILGGSLGASGLNRAVLEGVSLAPPLWRDRELIHQTGPQDCESVRRRYAELGLTARVEPLLDPEEMPHLMASAGIVVSRGGATTLAELACVGAATVVVPWEGAARDHQTLNARWYAEREAMLWAAESPVSVSGSGRTAPLSLGVALHQLASDSALRGELSRRLRELAMPDAVDRVIRVLEDDAAAL